MSDKTGNLRFHLDTWRLYTSDPWILQTVSGYQIDFDSCPIQQHIPKEIPFSDNEKILVDIEIQTLLKKGAIVPSFHEEGQFISTIFIVPKPNGKFRPVINLKYLNYFVTYEHFKQETFSVVLELIQKNDFFTSIDLKDAYFSIPIHSNFQKYLKFCWRGQLYKFVCLCFGLASAPRVFTKALKPIFSWFRHQGFRCSYYIDDSLNMNSVSAVCKQNAEVMSETLESLGYTINREKSVFVPTQRIVFFGFIIDSVLFKVFLPDDKVEKIIRLAKNLSSRKFVIVRDLASFIGLIISAFYAVLEAPLHYRPLEREKIKALGNTKDFDRKLCLSKNSIAELEWWISNVKERNGKSIRPEKPSLFIQSDASLDGWGAYEVNTERSIGGRWTEAEAENHINYLELLAIFYALQAFGSNKNSIHISIQSDNTCAVSYINNMGGMTSLASDLLAKNIWNWCMKRDLFISASYLCGSQNIEADFLSRNFSDTTEWMLRKDIFRKLCAQCFMPDIDLFASRLNYQVEKYVSWFPQPGAYKCNAFSFDWVDHHPYIFPPFNLIGRVLNKIVEDRVRKALLIIPHWVSQSWFPSLLSLLIDFPIRIPRYRDLLTLPHSGQLHPIGKSLSLIGVVVSGDVSRCRAFQRKLSRQSVTLGDQELKSNTVWRGRSGTFGVFRGKEIRFVRLK